MHTEPNSGTTTDQKQGSAAAISKRRFISLKWKSVVLVSTALIAVILSLSAIGYLEQRSQFEDQRDLLHQRYSTELAAIIDLSSQNLILAGDITSRLSGLHEALNEDAFDQIPAALEEHWPMFRFDLGIERLDVYCDEGKRLLSWNDGEESKAVDALIQDWVTRVNQTNFPISTIWCAAECTLFAVLPILTESAQHVVVLTTPLSDIVSRVASVTGVDTGILVPADHKQHEPRKDVELAAWDIHILALTGMQKNSRVLRAAAAQAPMHQVEKHPLELEFDGHTYELRLLPITSSLTTSAGHWVAIDDITTATQAINQARAQSLGVGTVGLLVSGLLLTFTLWSPMRRLIGVSLILPLLAEKAHRVARQKLDREIRPGALADDEIDLLRDSALTLSGRLETLESEVAQGMRDLQRERDFVAGLMDAADVLIVTQDNDNCLTMINPYGEHVTGRSLADTQGQRFCGLLDNLEQLPDLESRLRDLVSGAAQTVRHESVIRDAEGVTRQISWVHSNIENSASGNPAILSVGLDVTERKQAETHLAWLANHDALTKLFNRRRFQEELERVLAESQRSGRGGSLLYLDIDLFKDINDTSGHHAGDALLIQVADILRRSLRTVDIIGRLGGDEFAVILPETPSAEAVGVADKLGRDVARVPFNSMDQTYRISLSIGVTAYPTHGSSVPELLANADLAMYQAKASGRGRSHLFSTKDQSKERLHSRIHWKEGIELALGEDRFYLCFQPILHIASGSVSHFEVLLRMQDRDGSTIAPGEFIRAAEQTGQIGDIDRMVIAKAVEQLADCVAAGQDVRFSINLSGTAFDDSAMLPHFQFVFDRTRIDPGRVILEITETAAVADLSAAQHMIEALRRLGCRFSLDDFGVGFTSFTYLKQLPVDFVKIDGSFVRDLSGHSDDQLFVKALADIAHGLGKKTVAEFVENAESLAMLSKFGVDYAQGYHIGHPEPWDQAKRHLKR